MRRCARSSVRRGEIGGGHQASGPNDVGELVRLLLHILIVPFFLFLRYFFIEKKINNNLLKSIFSLVLYAHTHTHVHLL